MAWASAPLGEASPTPIERGCYSWFHPEDLTWSAELLNPSGNRKAKMLYKMETVNRAGKGQRLAPYFLCGWPRMIGRPCS